MLGRSQTGKAGREEPLPHVGANWLGREDKGTEANTDGE